MQRALFTTRTMAARGAGSSIARSAGVLATRNLRPQPAFAAVPKFAVRFNSTKPEEAKAEGAATEGAAEEPVELTPLEQVEAQLIKKDKELADMKNHYARAIADFRNLQDSTKREVQKAKDFALQKFAKDLLESLDNFALALTSIKPEMLDGNADVKNFHDGVSMTKTVFEKTLSRHGVEKIDPIGEAFDPNLHEATFEIAQPDKVPGTVFHVQQPGYTLNSRVLRPAKVGLVKDAN